MISTGVNWDLIKVELNSTKREGIEKLIDYLDKTDFKTAPASTKFHLNVTGGLAQHSLNVLKYARILTKEGGLVVKEDSIVLSSLLHDLCKVNFYVMGEEWDKEHKDKTNQWRKKSVWKIEDQDPLGHGEKSVMLSAKYIDLTIDEMAAIRWHMLNWDVSPAQTRTMQEAMNRYPLVKLIAISDQLAEFYESNSPATEGVISQSKVPSSLF